MAQLYVGTSGWAYPSWKPDFYPAKLAQAKFLQYYSTQLNAVEVNFTFRQLLKETTAQKWIAETPPGFRMSVKAHQVITHIKRLKKTEDFLPRFLGTIEPLARADKLGPLLFQLPPNLKADAALLQEFLTVLPRGRRRLSSSGTRPGSRRRFTRCCEVAISRCAWLKPKNVQLPMWSRRTSATTATASQTTRRKSDRRWSVESGSTSLPVETSSHTSNTKRRRKEPCTRWIC